MDDKSNIKTNNWLIEGMTEEQIQKFKWECNVISAVYNQLCNSCDFRHCCHRPSPLNICDHWKFGKCYTCKFVDASEEDWFKRGCESECFSGCEKYKRDWKKTFFVLKSKIFKR